MEALDDQRESVDDQRESPDDQRESLDDPRDPAHDFGIVLVVEDDPIMRRTLLRLMAPRCAQLLEADSVTSAARQLRLAEDPIDLVLLDVRLGDESGVDVASLASHLNPAPAVIAISGSADAAEGFALACYGVRAYIPKSELAHRMDELIVLARSAPALDPMLKAQVGVRSVKEMQEAVRDMMLDQALALEEGNQARAAKRLGVSRQAVQQMMRRREKGV